MRAWIAPVALASFFGFSGCSTDEFMASDAAPDVTDARADDGSSDGGALPVPEKLAEDGTPDAGVGLGRVAVDSDYVYWIREDTTTVKRAPKAGGPVESVKPPNTLSVDDLAVTADEVLTNGFNGGPYAYPKAGGAGRLLPSFPPGCQSGLRVFLGGTDVFYTYAECNGADAPIRVVRTKLDGDAGLLGLTAKPAAEIYGDVVADSTDVFVVSNEGVGRMPPDLTTHTLISSQAGAPATALALDATNLFARRVNGLAIVNRVSTDNVVVVKLPPEAIPIAVNAERRTQLAQDGTYVYVSANDGLYRIAKAPPHDKMMLYAGHGVVGVARDGGYLYFSVPDLAAIFRVKKPN